LRRLFTSPDGLHRLEETYHRFKIGLRQRCKQAAGLVFYSFRGKEGGKRDGLTCGRKEGKRDGLRGNLAKLEVAPSIPPLRSTKL
jgi:hypothetical protein